MAEVINKTCTCRGIMLVISLNDITSKCQVSVEKFESLVDSSEKSFIVILDCSAKVCS